MTPEQIEQVRKEIDDFQQKSLQFASASPSLSAHYHRLYISSQKTLKSIDRLARVQKNKAYQEQRRNAKQGASTQGTNGPAAPKRESAHT